jgi:HD-GYP domain-containing protein (c-di-GMP phosphodiesterase class II)
MALHAAEADPDGHARLERSRARLRLAPAGREERVERLAGTLFLVALATFWVSVPPGSGWLVAFAILSVAYAVCLAVEFEVGTGYTVPTLVVFVPMLFLLPPAVVPVAVVAGHLASFLFSVARGRRHLARFIVVFGQSWHALGAALVVAAWSPGAAQWSDALLVVAAFGAYVVFDALASLSVDHFGHGESVGSLVASTAWIYAIDVLLLPLGLALAIAADGHALAVGVAVPLCALLWIFAAERRQRIDHAIELSQAYRGTAILLGDMVETDDAYTGSHSRDVVELALEVGTRMGLDVYRLRYLEFGALLHDIGKIEVPKSILHKPGPLSEAEWKVMRRHTIDGQRMLESVGGVLSEVGYIVRCSHERWDGGGYPDGVAGETIPIEARICAVCDAFSAMTSNRSYRAAMPTELAMLELRAGSGSQFDPAAVDALLDALSARERLVAERADSALGHASAMP